MNGTRMRETAALIFAAAWVLFFTALAATAGAVAWFAFK